MRERREWRLIHGAWAGLFRPLAGKRLPLLRAGFWTDLTYWIFTPLVTKVLTRLSLIAAIIPVALIVHGRLETDLLVSGFGPLSRLPL